jgi:hypothetical protein
MANIFVPTPINVSGPWNIAREDCIGDSLGYINANTNYLALNQKTLSADIIKTNTTVATISSDSILRLKEGNQQGSMPMYGARAFVLFNPSSTASNLVVTTYNRSSTIVTVTTLTPHSFQVGMRFHFIGTTGGQATGQYTVSEVINSTQFRFISPVSGTILSGTGSIPRAEIINQGNVAHVGAVGIGQYIINFTTPMTDSNYSWSGSVGYDVSNQSAWVGLRHNTSYGLIKNNQWIYIGTYYANTLLATVHPREVSVICYR